MKGYWYEVGSAREFLTFVYCDCIEVWAGFWGMKILYSMLPISIQWLNVTFNENNKDIYFNLEECWLIRPVWFQTLEFEHWSFRNKKFLVESKMINNEILSANVKFRKARSRSFLINQWMHFFLMQFRSKIFGWLNC